MLNVSLVFELTCAACIGARLYQSILRQLFQNGFPTLTKGQGDGVTAHQGGFRALACALAMTQGNGSVLRSTAAPPCLWAWRAAGAAPHLAWPPDKRGGRQLLKTDGNIHLVRTNDGGPSIGAF